MSQHQVESASAFNTLLRYCTFTAILLQCCVKVRWVSSVNPNNFGFFSSGSTWSANFAYRCICRCSCVSGEKRVTAYLAFDTVSRFFM